MTFKDKIYKIGAPELPDSCLPLGMKVADNKTKVINLLAEMLWLEGVGRSSNKMMMIMMIHKNLTLYRIGNEVFVWKPC